MVAGSILVGTYNDVDIDYTILADCTNELSENGNGNMLVAKIENNNKEMVNWDNFRKIYNRDFRDDLFSVLFRISNDEITISNGHISSSFSIAVSDFNYDSDSHLNPKIGSGLKLFMPIPTFESQTNSIILSENLMVSLGVKIGDAVFLENKNQTSLSDDNEQKQEYIIAGSYPLNVDTEKTSYLNDVYENLNVSTVFVSTAKFNSNINNAYSPYVSFSKNTKLLKSAYIELKPLLKTNSGAHITIPDIPTNNQVINNTSFSTYSDQLRAAVNDDSSIMHIKVLSAILFALIAIFVFVFSRKLIKNFLVKIKFIIEKTPLFLTLYFTYATGIAVLGIAIQRFLIGNVSIQNYNFYITPTVSLNMLTLPFLIYFAFFVLIILSELYVKNVLEQYFENSLKLEDLLSEKGIEAIKYLTNNEKENKNVEIQKDKDSVVFFGSFVSPCKSAGACRTLYLAEMIGNLGYHVFISSMYKNGKIRDSFEYSKNVTFLPYATPPITFLDKFKAYFMPRSYVRKVLDLLNTEKIKTIIIYSAFPISAVLYIKSFCKKRNIKLVFDVVEHQIITQQSFKSFFAYYVQQMLINKVLITKKEKVVAISSQLKDFYAKKNIKVIEIPFISNTEKTPDCTRSESKFVKNEDKIYILYAGNPFKKRDLLADVIKGINSLSQEEQEKVCFIIAGITPENMLLSEGLSKNDLLLSKKHTVFLGRVDHNLIEFLYSVVDFTILVKPLNKSFSHAGFPTKISESFAHGVPVIANISSTLDNYLTDQNAIIIEGDKVSDIKEALEKVIKIDKDHILKMRFSSRQTSLERLDITGYEKAAEEFLKQ